MTKTELHWLAGWLEGEGSFMKGSPSCPNRPRISVQITDQDTADRGAKLMRAGTSKKRDKRNPKWKPVYQIIISGRKAVDLMLRLKPLMGSRRRGQIEAALACFEDRSKRLSTKDLRDIRRLVREGLAQRAVAEQFSIRRETVNKIVRRKGRYVIS